MIFGKTKLELKVGIFVFIGFVILAIFVLSIRGFKNWTSGYEVKFAFNFVNGVKIGAPVRLAGVDIGEVKRIKLFLIPQEAKTKVQVVCWVKGDTKVPVDSTIWVNTLGLLGEKYIEIMPGKNYSKYLDANKELAGQDPMPMQEVTEIAKRIGKNLDETIARINNREGTLGKLLYDDTLYKEIEAAIKNRDGTIGRFIYDDTIYKELEALIVDIRAHPWKLFWKTKEKPQKK